MRFEYGTYPEGSEEVQNVDINIDPHSYAEVLADLIPSLAHLLIVTPIRDSNPYMKTWGFDVPSHSKTVLMRILRDGGNGTVIQKVDEQEFPMFRNLWSTGLP